MPPEATEIAKDLTQKKTTIEVRYKGDTVLKLGEKGLYGVSRKNGKYLFALPAITNNAKDPVGAGDSLLAYTTLSFLIGCSLAESSIMGSLAASVACEFDGNAPVSKKMVVKKINQLIKSIDYK